MSTAPDYATWPIEKLVEQIQLLEKQNQELRTTCQQHAVKDSVPPQRSSSPKRKGRGNPISRDPARTYEASRYSTRYIALKFAYLGQNYGGFAYSALGSRPTVEEVLWHALCKARLISPRTEPRFKSASASTSASASASTTASGSASASTQMLDWDGCEYSKCGRTDRGVSAFGQVIGIRVRSNRPLPPNQTARSDEDRSSSQRTPPDQTSNPKDLPERREQVEKDNDASRSKDNFNHNQDELPYLRILNRLLPPDIRVLAWCPTPPPNFSARFSCRERRYRYFFTQPAFHVDALRSPMGGATRPAPQTQAAEALRGPGKQAGWLDIEAMQRAAKKFEGLHDFRNFCKIDGSKQIEDFRRRIFLAEVRKLDHSELPAAAMTGANGAAPNGVDPSTAMTQPGPEAYAFILHGSAFLWHQVRHMVAVLFLIGQGLEDASVIDKLLDPQQVPSKPSYDMADEVPLVLWDCVFPAENSDPHQDSLEWIYAGQAGPSQFAQKGRATPPNARPEYSTLQSHVVEDLWPVWRQRKMDEILAGSLLNVAMQQAKASRSQAGTAQVGTAQTGTHQTQAGSEVTFKGPLNGNTGSTRLFLGGSNPRPCGRYIPLLQRKRMESPSAINARWLTRGNHASRREALVLRAQQSSDPRSDGRLDHIQDTQDDKGVAEQTG